MRAARFAGGGAVVIEERADPCPGTGEVVLEVAHCAFCGSDKRLLATGASVVPGHEIVGRVVAVGEGGDGPALGQLAAVYAPLFCGSCPWCRCGESQRCSAMAGVIGWQVDGGFADKVRVPFRNLLPVPPDVPPRRAVLVLDTLGTAAHGLDRAAEVMGRPHGEPDGRVLVLGCGPLGLGVVGVARHRGQKVYAYDRLPERLELAVSLGAVPWDAEPAGSEEGEDRFGLVVEAAGDSGARATASRVVGQGGAVLMLGEGAEPWSLPPSLHWRRTEAAWVRSFYFPIADAERNWGLLREAGGALEELVLCAEPFSELPRVSKAFLAGEVTKPVVDVAGA
ncbi:MAG TPA: alcohol dehydrogenase catalytic domain-containing protein [Acidimicrobiales bacterium]|nr:alcohol dehydrogenase catalytic domain-containing protein [Acidimicrobiales bacterium]